MKIEEKKVEAEVLESSNKVTLIDDDNEEIVAKKEVKKGKHAEQPDAKKAETESKKQEVKKYNNYEVKESKKEGKSFIIVSILLVLIVLLIVAFCTIFALINSNNQKILSGVSVRNTKIEGLTKSEAIELVNKAVEEEQQHGVTIKINGDEYSISQDQIQTAYNVEKAI